MCIWFKVEAYTDRSGLTNGASPWCTKWPPILIRYYVHRNTQTALLASERKSFPVANPPLIFVHENNPFLSFSLFAVKSYSVIKRECDEVRIE